MRDRTNKIIIPGEGRRRVQTMNLKPSRTKPEFADECDINNIMRRYASTGEFTHLTSKKGAYRDFSGITDYQDMLHTVKYAQEAFMALPADVRLRFRNDPNELLMFVQDPKNYDEGVKLGLVQPKDNQKSGNEKGKNDINEKAQNEAPKKMKSKTAAISEIPLDDL